MPDASSDSARGKAWMLAWNVFPLTHLCMVAAVLLVPWASPPSRAVSSVFALLVMPPLLGRLLRWRHLLVDGRHQVSSGVFRTWWALSCLQALFNRIGVIEEAMRLVPGLYSMWLRLWGARVGRLTFWGPGARLLDRSLITVGNDVVIGAGVEISSHLLSRTDGELILVLGVVDLGDGAVLGGHSRVGPGVTVAAGETTLSCVVLPPFNRFTGGRRQRPA